MCFQAPLASYSTFFDDRPRNRHTGVPSACWLQSHWEGIGIPGLGAVDALLGRLRAIPLVHLHGVGRPLRPRALAAHSAAAARARPRHGSRGVQPHPLQRLLPTTQSRQASGDAYGHSLHSTSSASLALNGQWATPSVRCVIRISDMACRDTSHPEIAL